MSAVGDAVARLVTDLQAAGVPTSDNPDTIAPLIASHGAVAYILPPEVESRHLSRGMRLVTEIALIGAPPGGRQQFMPVWEYLGPVMDAVTARQAQTTTQTVGAVTYPGYRINAITNTPC